MANIGVLTASSFLIGVAHLRKSVTYYLLVLLLGVVFLFNQVDEMFSTATLSGSEESSLVLFCLYTHLSHLVISLIFFARFLLRVSDMYSDNVILFVTAYWHLVELVWIVILSTLAPI